MTKTNINNELAILSDFEALIQRVRTSSMSSRDKELVMALIKDSAPYMIASLNENLPMIEENDFLNMEADLSELNFDIDPDNLMF